jgi:hypothetical protein
MLWSAQAPGPSREEMLARHRNLGKAFYENPATPLQAVDELKRALDLAPTSARDRLNWGLALLRAGKTAEGVAELERVQKQDPSIPHTWFNLGVQYKKNGDYDRATAQFERMVKLVPDEPVSHYQLGTLYRLAGRQPDAIREFETAARLDPAFAAPQFQLFNIHRQQGRQDEASRRLALFQEIKKQQEGAAIPEDVDWSDYAELLDPPPPALPPAPPLKSTSRTLPAKLDPKTAGLAVADLNGDGVADLIAWSAATGVRAWRNAATPVADPVLAALQGVHWVSPGDFDNDGLADLAVLTESGPALLRNVKGRFQRHAASLPAGRFRRALWIDYDHDYDLDLILLGDRSALARNQGAAGFADRTADIPFPAGSVSDAVALRVVPDSRAFDFAVTYTDRAGALFRDRLGGRYEVEPLRAAFAPVGRSVSADFGNDGRADVATINAAGNIEVRTTQGAGSWIRVQLAGVKNLKLAHGAEVEVKAGLHYQKKAYEGVPLLFLLPPMREVDTVRITWPNGLIQNETRQATGRGYTYKEAQRLSGSCPSIWTWNGRRFQFITDVLGVAPLGASAGDGEYFPVDHDEYVAIPPGALVARDGMFEVRITEELAEVTYLDEVKLIAADHPERLEVLTNDKFQAPPFPPWKLIGVRRRVDPVAARDQRGSDVLPRIRSRDRRYADTFSRTSGGVAEIHSIELEFPEAPHRAALVLSGWVDWADGSTFLGESQAGRGLVFPRLEAGDAGGVWRTVVEDMGLPAGKPKTIVVELPAPTPRSLRIVTNLCAYWDEIYLAETADPQARITALAPAAAALGFRGFSRVRIHPERKQPEMFYYADPRSTSMWDQTPGFYTGYGDVRPLVEEVDDRLVVMGSGDELRLAFRASSLPPVKTGWRRSFFLKVDGWAKDRDPNTAHSQTVEPLPFHGMSRYPYPAGERYPEEKRGQLTRPALRLLR